MSEKGERTLGSRKITKPLQREQHEGTDEVGSEGKITMFCSPLYPPTPNQLVAHRSDSINAEGQRKGILDSYVRYVRKSHCRIQEETGKICSCEAKVEL